MLWRDADIQLLKLCSSLRAVYIELIWISGAQFRDKVSKFQIKQVVLSLTVSVLASESLHYIRLLHFYKFITQLK